MKNQVGYDADADVARTENADLAKSMFCRNSMLCSLLLSCFVTSR